MNKLANLQIVIIAKPNVQDQVVLPEELGLIKAYLPEILKESLTQLELDKE